MLWRVLVVCSFLLLHSILLHGYVKFVYPFHFDGHLGSIYSYLYY